jgi:hypothetical protein
LGQVYQTVLIPGVNAMLGKVGGVRIIEEVVDGSDDWVLKDFCEVEFARGIKRRVYADGNESCKESGRRKEDEGKGPIFMSASINERQQDYSLAQKMGQQCDCRK